MTNEIPHPDRLAPGDFVGPWKILEVLGAGGFGRVFKVESEGKVFALKMAVRLPGEKLPGEEDVDGRCLREATAMMQRTPHPNVPRVFSVGRWPDAESGFLFVVMEFIDGWSFHDWRYATHPTAAQLVDVMLPLVRTVADLHKSGVHHRDLNANNVLIRKEDGRPFLLDFGSVRLPGARTLTQGLPPVNLEVAPPELFEHLQALGDDARFNGGEKADLYALGVLLYGALADGYPFKPDLPLEKLAAVIQLRMPRAPRWINPKAPKSLSAITMRLLAKRPDERFESAEALHRALWEANKNRASREWRVPLDLPERGPAPMTEEELQERKLDEERAERTAWAREQKKDTAPPKQDAAEAPAEQARSESMNSGEPRHTRRVRRLLLSIATACALGVGLVALAWWWRYSPSNTAPATVARPTPTMNAGPGEKVAPPSESPEAMAAAASSEAAPKPVIIATGAMPPEDTTPVTTLTNVQSKQPSTALRAARKLAGAAITCSALAGCPGAQVRPAPPAEACPEGALEAMARWGIQPGDDHLATFEPVRSARVITVSEGPTTVYITGGAFNKLPGAGPLSGRLIFAERVYGRLTEAEVDGRTFPVCFELEDRTERVRGLVREPNGSANTVKVFSSVTVKAVRKFE
jgi:serine/threonine-protein kinase